MALTKSPTKEQPFEVRNSRVHGKGAFALRRIKKGTRLIEYLGDRITHAEADHRYEDCDENDNHTFLFVVDRRMVIDAGIDGNDARFINHACDPNSESEIEDRRVFIDAIKDIGPGEELNYDYQIGREKTDPANVDEIYACRCGSPKCRGTMLWPAKRPKARKKAKVKAKARAKSKGTGKAKRPVTRAKSGSAVAKKSRAGDRFTASRKGKRKK